MEGFYHTGHIQYQPTTKYASKSFQWSMGWNLSHYQLTTIIDDTQDFNTWKMLTYSMLNFSFSLFE